MHPRPVDTGERRKRQGITLLETLVVAVLTILIITTAIVNLSGRRGQTEFTTTRDQMVSLLREARNRAMSQRSSTVWGVHFENRTTTLPFYVMFSGSYSTATRESVVIMPTIVQYSSSSLAAGASRDFIFSEISGRTTSGTITIMNLMNARISTTISVATSGFISYTE